MRKTLLTLAALAAVATPALAQDRTLPAGAYTSFQAPIDSIGTRAFVPVNPTLEGRSVSQDEAPVARTRAQPRS